LKLFIKINDMLRNQILSIGNLGKASEVKYLKSGKSVTSLHLATSDFYTNAQDEKVEETQWHHCC
jgi:single-strand DNA-binding protein